VQRNEAAGIAPASALVDPAAATVVRAPVNVVTVAAAGVVAPSVPFITPPVIVGEVIVGEVIVVLVIVAPVIAAPVIVVPATSAGSENATPTEIVLGIGQSFQKSSGAF
jgi:hypothetical protein